MPPLSLDHLTVSHRNQCVPTDTNLAWTFGHGEDAIPPRDALTPSCALCSFNVRSLKSEEKGASAFIPGRLHYVENQLVDLGLQIIGLQETRGRQNDMVTNSHFHKFRAAALRGHGGTELWIRKDATLGWIGHTPLRLSPHQAIVLHAAPDLLIVKFPSGLGQHLVFTVGHAPHKGYEDETKRAWWQRLLALLTSHKGNTQHVLLLDANAAL